MATTAERDTSAEPGTDDKAPFISTLKEAQDAVKAAVPLDDEAYAANEAYLEKDDHWQEGKGWPGTVGVDQAVLAVILARVKGQFTPVDIVGEVLGRVVNGVLKREPAVEFVPIDLEPAPEKEAPEAKVIREAKEATVRAEGEAMRAALSTWWDGVRLWERTRESVRRSRWATRGTLRLRLPAGRMAKAVDGDPALPAGLTFPAALALLDLDAPAPNTAAIVTHPDTKERAAVFLYTEDKADAAEVWTVQGDETVVQVLTQGAPRVYRVRMGGRLNMAEMRAPLLITEAVRRQQIAANFVQTIFLRTVETAGFPERYTINAASAGIWLPTKPRNGQWIATRVDAGQTEYLHPVPRQLGAYMTTDLIGVKYDTGEGRTTIATPGVERFDPVDPEFATKGARFARATILESCAQGHVLRGGDSAESGYSQEQRRADFEADLTNTAAPAEGMLREIIEGAIAWAASMTPDGDASRTFLERFRCAVTLHISAGPASPEQQEQDAKAVERRLMPRTMAMARLGIEDVAAAVDEIDGEVSARLALSGAKAVVVGQWIDDAGADREAAHAMAGLDEAEQELLRTNAGVTPGLDGVEQ